MAVMFVSDHEVTVAAVPLKVTVPCITPKPVPVMVTGAPTGPDAGDREAMKGAFKTSTRTFAAACSASVGLLTITNKDWLVGTHTSNESPDFPSRRKGMGCPGARTPGSATKTSTSAAPVTSSAVTVNHWSRPGSGLIATRHTWAEKGGCGLQAQETGCETPALWPAVYGGSVSLRVADSQGSSACGPTSSERTNQWAKRR